MRDIRNIRRVYRIQGAVVIDSTLDRSSHVDAISSSESALLVGGNVSERRLAYFSHSW